MSPRRLGQHFLRDPKHLEAMLRAAALRAADLVIEVGPGRGVLTKPLCRQAGFVVAVELDRTLAEGLPARIGGPGNLLVTHQDVLRADFSRLIELGRTAWERAAGSAAGADLAPVKVVANLPFFLTAPLLARLQEARALFHRLVLMVQLEVAQRLLAAPGEDSYGAPSVMMSYDFEMAWVGKVPARAFHPAPQVDAGVVSLVPRASPPVDAGSREDLSFLVHAAFGQRRKTLREALGRALAPRAGASRKEGRAAAQTLLDEAGIEPARRGETLSLDEFAALSRILPQVAPP